MEFDSVGEQQRSSVLTLLGPPKGVPGSAGEPGAAGPCALPARECAFQLDHHVRTGIVTQHAEETGSAGGCGQARGRQLQHAVPQTGVISNRPGVH